MRLDKKRHQIDAFLVLVDGFDMKMSKPLKSAKKTIKIDVFQPKHAVAESTSTTSLNKNHIYNFCHAAPHS